MTSNPDEWIVCEHRAFAVTLMRSAAISRNCRESHFCFILRDELRCVLRQQRSGFRRKFVCEFRRRLVPNRAVQPLLIPGPLEFRTQNLGFQGRTETSRLVNSVFIRLLDDSPYLYSSLQPRYPPVARTRMLFCQLMQTLANLPLFIIDPCLVRCVDRDFFTNRQAIRSNADMQISWPTTGIRARRHMCSELEHLTASIRNNQTVHC